MVREVDLYPQTLIEKANPSFYGGGSDTHSIEGLGTALDINIGTNEGSKREIIYRSIINSKDPEISTIRTISAFNVDSKCVKDVIRAKWSSLKGGLRFGWGTIKTAGVVGKEVYDYVADDKKLRKLSQEKIEGLIAKTMDPNSKIEELYEIKKEINKPNVLLAMNEDQRKRYIKALRTKIYILGKERVIKDIEEFLRRERELRGVGIRERIKARG